MNPENPHEATAQVTDENSLLIEFRKHGVSVEVYPDGKVIAMTSNGKGMNVYEFDLPPKNPEGV